MKTQLSLSAIQQQFRLPTVVSWNRLEPRPRTSDFERSLRAEVRDPLWMLARQWQMGELNGEDGGSPVFAKVQVKTSSLTKFKDGKGTIRAFDNSAPIEAQVEQLPDDQTLASKIRAGNYWLKMLKNSALSDVTGYQNAFRDQYKIELPVENSSSAQIFAHKRSHQWYLASAGRSMDGLKLFSLLDAGGKATDGITLSRPEDEDEDILIKLGDAFKDAWKNLIFSQAEKLDETNWQEEKLEYSFACSAPTETDGSSEDVLTAEEYYQGHLDWYNFDKSSDTLLGTKETPPTQTVKSETISFIPAPAQFPGMPNRRWWEFEDRQTDLGGMNATTTDTGRLLLSECALIYGNDWYIFPYPLSTGSLARIKGLAVTDNFGVRTWIEESGKNRSWENWNLFGITKEDGSTESLLVLPPSVNKLLEGESLEEVNFLRDEMANFVWAVESTVQLENGEGYSGFIAAKEFRAWMLSEIYGVEDTITPSTTTDADIRYNLENSVPENWIPFIPVHLEGSDRDTRLRRGAMLRYAEGITSPEKITPRTLVLSPGLAEGNFYDIDEEEVTRSGAIISRNWQRARWYDGSTFLWMGFKKETGKGERNSGLKFDQVEHVKKES
jgi:hypothetical protein